jgi:hypothetical protein
MVERRCGAARRRVLRDCATPSRAGKPSFIASSTRTLILLAADQIDIYCEEQFKRFVIDNH